MAAGVRHRYRVWFAKTGPLRFISHHDLMRLFQRAIRRADLPISFSQGFNPRPRISYLAPLPVYHEGLREILVIDLEQPRDPRQIIQDLSPQLPEGLRIVDLRQVPSNKRTRVTSFLYTLHLTSPLDAGFRPPAVHNLLIRRKSKNGAERTMLVADYLRGMSFQPDAICIKLEVIDGRTLRPEELLRALNLFLVHASEHPRIVRNAVEVEN